MIRALIIALAALLAWPASAQDAPGRFDYYVLALSWSPTYCADPKAAERDRLQCGMSRRYAFVLHGLWPQREKGWPEQCPTSVRDVPQPIVQKQLDIMPSPGLVQYQWDKHGSCSGLAPAAYFDLARKLRASVATPAPYAAPAKALAVSASEVKQQFLAANPKLKANGIAVTCRDNRLQEVRICLTKDGAPRACGADVRDRCTGGKVAMLPVR